MDSLPTGPELPDESGIVQRNDQTLLGLSEELVQFASEVHDHCSEGRIQKAYTSLYSVLSCSQLLIHGLPFFQPVQAVINGPLPADFDKVSIEDPEFEGDDELQLNASTIVPRIPSLEMVRSLYGEGQAEKAYEELGKVLDELTVLMQVFTYDKPMLSDEDDGK